jgi:proline iminopeptidase
MLVDQRGAGKSKPFAGLKGNNTKNLIEDFSKLLKFMGIKKTLLYGGSWGSYLSLCFAIKHPDAVGGMVLRGIWFGDDLKSDYLFTGGPKTHFPEVWQRFTGVAPSEKGALRFYFKKMFSSNMKTALKYCREWSRYELSLISLNHDAKRISKMLRGKWIIPFARLESYYIKNNCFMPKNYILKNVRKIKHIPLSIIHGRYDFVTMPSTAYVLHKALPISRLFFVTAGHSGSDPEIRNKMMEEIHRMAKSVSKN